MDNGSIRPHHLDRRHYHSWLLFLGLLLLAGRMTAADPTACQLCNTPFAITAYTTTDKVTGEKLWICGECTKLPHRCFACGLPILKDLTSLSDNRHYCARDAREAVIENQAIFELVRDTQQRLAEQFRDQLVLPIGKTDIRPVDRITIETLFARPGNDFRCPNIMGFYQTIGEGEERRHDISLLAGLTATGTRAVYAHELAHAWSADNVPAGRGLDRDAKEGFCELIAYLLMEQMGDQKGMRDIEQNPYTRGQFARFREAQRTYTLRAVLDWMRHGTDPRIDDASVDHILQISPPAKPVKPLWQISQAAATAAENTLAEQNNELRLKGVVGTDQRRTALINDRSFAVGETGRIQLKGGKIEIRVLEIGADFVRIVRTDSDTGTAETLRLSRP